MTSDRNNRSDTHRKQQQPGSGTVRNQQSQQQTGPGNRQQGENQVRRDQQGGNLSNQDRNPPQGQDRDRDR